MKQIKASLSYRCATDHGGYEDDDDGGDGNNDDGVLEQVEQRLKITKSAMTTVIHVKDRLAQLAGNPCNLTAT